MDDLIDLLEAYSTLHESVRALERIASAAKKEHKRRLIRVHAEQLEGVGYLLKLLINQKLSSLGLELCLFPYFCNHECDECMAGPNCGSRGQEGCEATAHRKGSDD